MHEYLITSEVPTHHNYRVIAETLTDAFRQVEDGEVLSSERIPDYDEAKVYCTSIDGRPFSPFIQQES